MITVYFTLTLTQYNTRTRRSEKKSGYVEVTAESEDVAKAAYHVKYNQYTGIWSAAKFNPPAYAVKFATITQLHR